MEVVPGVSASLPQRLSSELTIPGVVQTIVPGRAGGGRVPSEELDRLAALWASPPYLSARHINEVQATLQRHYDDTPVAIAYRVSWPDEWMSVVPLSQMAAASHKRQLIRTPCTSSALHSMEDSNDRVCIHRIMTTCSAGH